MKYYNILLDIKDKRCVVIGGGKVALRKARKLCAAHADVLVVAPNIHPSFADISSSIAEMREKTYDSSDLDGAFLVFATTSCPATNKAICIEAMSRGILTSSVNGVDYGNFIIPATCTQGMLNVSISTDGLAPSLSKHLRKHLQRQIQQIEIKSLEEIVALRKEMLSSQDETKRKAIEEVIDKKVNNIITTMSKSIAIDN